MANGYVRYGNSIHLDGFQILDFCIENAISLESLRDLNLGRKVFLTGNDTNAGYLRENVWDGDRWRAAAYLDDLTSFKDEDFNKLKEKVDTLIGDGVDMDGIIESWKEVEAFLAGMSDTKNLMDLLNSKLDKTGGTIYKDGNPVPLTIKSTGESTGKYAGLGLKIGENGRAVLAYYGGLDWRVTNESYQSEAMILHNLNFNSIIGDTYLKTGGSNRMKSGIPFVVNEAIDYNNAGNGIRMLFQSSANAPATWMRSLSVFEGSSGFQIGVIVLDSKERLYYRQTLTDNAWSDWKTIAFTDSTVEAANRLAKKVSLWGNEFDGTQNLNGNLSLGSSRIFWASNSDAYYIGSSYALSEGAPNLDYSGFAGHRFLIRSNVSAMAITGEGNVNIGTSFEGFKFSVYGGMTFLHGVESSALALGQMPTNGLLVGNPNYGIGQWFQGGQGHIQASSFGNTTATAYALNLNPLGGAVNIASADAPTNVFGELKVGSGTIGYINMVGSSVNYLWAANTIHIGLSTVGGRSGDNATLTIKNDSIHSGFRNNAVSLGISSSRWSDVYSVGGNFSGNVRIANDYGLLSTTTSGSVVQMVGITKNNALFVGTDACIVNKMITSVYGSLINFYTGATLETRTKTMTLTSSGHVLIGEAVDDADYALNVKGDSYFGGTVYIPTGQKLTIGSVTFEEDAAGRVKVDGDMYTTGTLASGGKAKEGTGTGSGSANVRDFELPADEKTTYYCDHMLKTKNVIVQVFEKVIQNSIEVWDMIVADVTIVTEDRVTVTFGRPTTKVHKVHIIGGNVS